MYIHGSHGYSQVLMQLHNIYCVTEVCRGRSDSWNWCRLSIIILESDMKMTRGVALPVAVDMRF